MKKCLIVLGMHRSGTSALTGVLKILGVEIGSNLLVASPHNPKGYFELLDVAKLDEKILARLNSSWDSPYVLPENWWNGSELIEYRKEASQIIRKHFEHTDITSIKDPRMCRTLPFWSEVFKELDVNPYYIIPLRNPLEIADSLRNRNGFSLEKSLLLWMTYMLDAELYSRGYPRVFTTFDNLLKDTPDVIDRISTKLNIKFPKNYQDSKEDIAQFLDHNLKHNKKDADSIDSVMSEEIFSFYRQLSLFIADGAAGEDGTSEIDKIRERYFSLNKFFYNKDVLNIAIEEKERAAAEKKRIIAKYESKFIYIPWLKKVEKNLKKSFRQKQKTHEK